MKRALAGLRARGSRTGLSALGVLAAAVVVGTASCWYAVRSRRRSPVTT